MLVSGVQQSDSVTHIHIYMYIYIFFFRFFYLIGYYKILRAVPCALCYTARLFGLSILYIGVCFVNNSKNRVTI